MRPHEIKNKISRSKRVANVSSFLASSVFSQPSQLSDSFRLSPDGHPLVIREAGVERWLKRSHQFLAISAYTLLTLAAKPLAAFLEVEYARGLLPRKALR
jgi:hypothetical protein